MSRIHDYAGPICKYGKLRQRAGSLRPLALSVTEVWLPPGGQYQFLAWLLFGEGSN